MKTAVVIFAFISLARSQQEVPGEPRSGRAVTTQVCPDGAVGPTCVDCGTLLTCVAGSTEPVDATPCSSINPSFLSCDGGFCSSAQSTDPNCASNDYTCTGPGQFPDPVNCSLYYYCDGVGSTASVFQCPPNYVYNSQTGLCRFWFCLNVDCSRSPGKYVLHPADPSVIVFCPKQGLGLKPFVYRCPDPQNMQYSLDTLKCSFKCRSQGRYADRTNCRRYYECYISGLIFQSRLVTCPIGYAYNSTNQLCVKQSTCKNEIDQAEVDTTSTTQ